MTKLSRFMLTTVALVLAALILAPAAEAQRQRRNRQDGHKYDPATVSTVTATVREVTTESGRGGAAGTHLILESEEATTVAHVGPASFMSANGLNVEVGDEVTVTGSKVVVDEEQAVIVSEIRSGGITLVLRDDSGLPAWRGQGPRATDGRGNGRGPRATDATSADRRGPRATDDNRGNPRGSRLADDSSDSPRGPRNGVAGAGRRKGWRAADTEGSPSPRRGNRSCPRRNTVVADA